MAGSVLTGFPYIQEGSEATPGLWNNIFSTLSQNITEANSLGNVLSAISTVGTVTINANSNVTDYIHFHDSSGQRSDYLISSFNTGTADGLNIYDASGQTMIVSFSKQSIRFYQQVVGPVFDVGGALASTYNAATFGSGTDSTESRIQAAINQAVTDSIQRVYIPASMLSYSAASMTFSTSVQMVREGGDWTVYDVTAYGAKGDGVHDDTYAIQSAESARPANKTLRAVSGTFLVNTTYNGTLGEKGKLLRVLSTGAWNFAGATLKWGSATALGTGTDGGGLGMVNVLANDVTLSGTLSAQSLVKFPLALKDTTSGCIVALSITSVFEPGFWSGIVHNVSVDVTGTSITTRATNLSGSLKRPQAPFMNSGGVITSHIDVSALLMGSVFIQGNASGTALVGGTQNDYRLVRLDITGLPLNIFPNDANATLKDFVAHDGGFDVIELAGENTPAAVAAFGMLNGDGLASCTKNGSLMVVSSGNLGTDASTPSATWSARTQGGAELDFNYSATAGGRVVHKAIALTSGQTVASSSLSGDIFTLTLTSDCTITAPTFARQGQRLTYLLTQDSTGSRLLTWASAFSTQWNNTGNAANAAAAIDFVNDGTYWQQDAWRKYPKAVTFVDTGTLGAPGLAVSSETSLGFYRSNASVLALSYGQLAGPTGGASPQLMPSVIINSDRSMGLYDAGAHFLGIVSQGAAVAFVSPAQFRLAVVGTAIQPVLTFNSEASLGLFRSGVSTIRMSYGQFSADSGSKATPGIGFSDTSLGFYKSGASTVALSYGGLGINAGANQSFGTAVLGSNGSVNVATSYVLTGDVIFLTDQTPGGTLGDLEIGGIRNASGFTIVSTSVTDTSTVGWLIIRPI